MRKKKFNFEGKNQVEVFQFLNTNQQLKAVKELFPKNEKAKDEKDRNHKVDQQIIRGNLIYKTGDKKG